MVNSSEAIPDDVDCSKKILEMSLGELKTFYSWLGSVITDREAEAALEALPLKKGREVLERRKAGRVTYQLEKVKCGKKKCKCSKGKLHGPYWYSYSWNGKKVISSYIGKELEQSVGREIKPIVGD